MEELTKKEEEIMLVFWQLEKAFVKDIIASLPQDPKPPYNTISSVVRILARKGYLDFKKYGNTYEYFPAISKADYKKGFMKKLMKGYFDNSPASMLSYIVNEEELSESEIAAAMRWMAENERMIVEGSAALCVASLMKTKEQWTGKTVDIVLCGRNITMSKFLTVMDQGDWPRITPTW